MHRGMSLAHQCSLTLGGGFGVLTGRHGLVIDNLLGATIVLANGSVVTVDDQGNSDVGLVFRYHFKARAESLSCCGVFEEVASTSEWSRAS